MLAYFGGEVSAHEVRLLTGVSRDCLNASDLRRTAVFLGFECRASTMELAALIGEPMPVIIHLRFIHFVVLEALDGTSARINCPNAGILEMLYEELDESFTGIVLRLKPGPGFRRSLVMKSAERDWWLFLLRGVRLEIVGAAIFSLGRVSALVALMILLPLAMRHMVSVAALLLFILASGAAVGVTLRAGRESLRRTLRNRLVTRLTGVDPGFFVYRLPSVVHGVLSSASSIPEKIMVQAIPALLAIFEIMLLLGSAFWMDAKVGVGVLVSVALWSIGMGLCLWWRINEGKEQDPSEHPDVEATLETLVTLSNSRLGAGPQRSLLAQMGNAAAVQSVRMKTALVPSMMSALPFVLSGCCFLVVGARLQAVGRPTALSLVGIGCLLGLIAARLKDLRGLYKALRRSSMAMRDVLDEPLPSKAGTTGWVLPLDSSVELRHVFFRFNPNKAPLLKDVSLTVHPGEQCGITGPSGGGKSTLTEILTGLHKVESGDVVFGGVRADKVAPSILSKWVARVDRMPLVFEGTVRENLLLGDPAISEEDLAAAIADASLDSILDGLSGGLSARVAYQGRNFSGGQLQRLEIARALARNPSVLILDDAVDALDLATEFRIREALRRRKCTLLLVTHRASSLAACDRVLHIHDGRLFDEPAPSSSKSVRHDDRFEALHIAPPAVTLTEAQAEHLLTAWRHLYPDELAKPPTLPHAGVSRLAALEELAVKHRLNVRPVRFVVSRDWRQDAGKLIAFRKDGTPLAVWPGLTHPLFFDPVNNLSGRLLQPQIDNLSKDAFSLVQKSDENPTSLFPWICGIFLDVRREVSATVFLLLIACPMILLWFGRSLSAASPRHVLTSSTLMAGSIVTLWIAYQQSRLRLGSSLVSTLVGRTNHLVQRLSPDFVRQSDVAALQEGLAGIATLPHRLASQTSKGVFACLLATGALLWIFCTEGSLPALSVGLACTLAILLHVVPAFAGRFHRKLLTPLQIRARRYLFTSLLGAGRLRAMGAQSRQLDRWLDLDDDYAEAKANLGRAEGDAYCLQAAPLVAALLTVSKLQLPLHMAIQSMILAWLAVMASSIAGDQGRRFLLDGWLRDSVRGLLAAPRELGKTLVRAASSPIRADNVACVYPDASRPAFRGVSLEFNPQSITVLTGPSGGGKSTLLRVLLGLQRPYAGIVSVGGSPIEDIDVVEWRTQISVVLQGQHLEETVSLRGHLSSAGQTTLQDTWEVLDIVDLSDEIRAMPMGLQTIVEPGRISNGQQQRLMIAAALLSRPAFLVLDELTNAIPDALQARIFERLRARGVGCLAVSHREGLVRLADRVHVIDRGSVVFSGAPEELGRRNDVFRAPEIEETA